MKHAVKRIHFVGIGGAGMSGIAEILHNLGYAISGSDAADSSTTRRLRELGITFCLGHAAEHLGQAQAVVGTGRCASPAPATCRMLLSLPR